MEIWYIYASAASWNPHSSLQLDRNWARRAIQSALCKCPWGLPSESEVEELPSAHRAPSVLLSSGFFSQWEHPPFFLDAQRVARVFRGWEDQKSLLFLEREGMTR